MHPTKLPTLPTVPRTRIIQVLVVGGVALIVAGVFWIAFTLPVSAIIQMLGGQEGFRTDAQMTVQFATVAIEAIPIIAGLIILAWGITRTTEERETGISSL